MREEDFRKSSPHMHHKRYSLVVAWNKDSAALGSAVVRYLSEHLDCSESCGMGFDQFYSFGGVTVEDNVIQFPESKFYTCENNKLLMCISDPPHYEWYAFLNTLIDMSQKYGGVEEIYTIGGMVDVTAHLSSRRIFPVFNSVEMKEGMGSFHPMEGIEYQTPPGQRPTLSSFLSWIAKKRNIPGVNLWVAVPFYLVAVGDAMANKTALQFFDKKFSLSMDFQQIDEEIRMQNDKIADMRVRSSEIDGYLKKVEEGLNLSEEENISLINEIGEIFKKDT